MPEADYEKMLIVAAAEQIILGARKPYLLENALADKPSVSLLAGHDYYNSAIKLAVGMRHLYIPKEINVVRFGGDSHRLALVASWKDDDIKYVQQGVTRINEMVLGDMWMQSLISVFTIFYPDGRIFHNVDKLMDDPHNQYYDFLSKTVKHLKGYFGLRNPTFDSDLMTKMPKFKEFLQRND